MSNTFLTPSQITRTALAVLHQKCNFLGSINRAYDDSFANDGAKIGSSLRIRQPNQYVVRSGATLSAQDTTENSITLNVTTQKGVDLNFTSADLTMQLDDFKARILEPAMAVLAANIENDAFSMINDVWNNVGTAGSALTFRTALMARKKLVDNLTPADGDRNIRLNTQDNVDMVDALKGLFQSSTQIKKQYEEGVLGETAGFTWAENTLLQPFTPGARSGYIVNGATQTGSSLVVSTGTGAVSVGEMFTIAGVYQVHPETKATTANLQQFVVTAAYAGGAGTVSIAPAIVTSGATQNVSASPANSAVITFTGTASTAFGQSLAYHKDAFTFATADLVMPQGVDMAARHVIDGISMRLVRMYDINNDKFPCRLDILYGYKTLRAQLAARLIAN